MSHCSVTRILIQNACSLQRFIVFSFWFHRKSLFRVHENTVERRLLMVHILLHISWALYRHIHLVLRTIWYSILTYDLHRMLFMSIAMIDIATLYLNFGRLQSFLMLCYHYSTYFIISPLAFIFGHGPSSLANCLELVPRDSTIIFLIRLLLYLFQLLSEIHYRSLITIAISPLC